MPASGTKTSSNQWIDRRLIPGEGRPDSSHSENHSRCVRDGPDSETLDVLLEITITVSGDPIRKMLTYNGLSFE
jgi:hypothetical protein